LRRHWRLLLLLPGAAHAACQLPHDWGLRLLPWDADGLPTLCALLRLLLPAWLLLLLPA
jgi:hypothetical protein